MESTERECGRKSCESLLNLQKIYLNALQSREREVLQFLAIFVAGAGAFAWLIKEKANFHYIYFTSATALILILLYAGIIYSMALSFNYRSVVLQIRKLEYALDVDKHILNAWLGIESRESENSTPYALARRYRKKYCEEIQTAKIPPCLKGMLNEAFVTKKYTEMVNLEPEIFLPFTLSYLSAAILILLALPLLTKQVFSLIISVVFFITLTVCVNFFLERYRSRLCDIAKAELKDIEKA